MPALIRLEMHTARKPHRCDSCGGVIKPGTPYHRARCADGGEAWTFKTHPACQKASKILWDQGVTGDDDALLNVSDMDPEDRAAVFDASPEVYRAVWPDRPVPSRPAPVN